METAMPCEVWRRRRASKPQETGASGSTDPKKKTKYACIVEAHKSTRKGLESALPRNHHEDRIAEKGFDSMNHCNLVYKVSLMPQAMKIPDANAVLDKEWEKLETLPAWQLESEEQER